MTIQIYVCKSVPEEAICQVVWIELLNNRSLENHYWFNAFVLGQAVGEYASKTQLSHINQLMHITTAAEPYGNEYKKKFNGDKYAKKPGFIYFLPKKLSHAEVIEYVTENMRQLFCNKEFCSIYKEHHCQIFVNDKKLSELDPTNQSSNSWWRKIDDALHRPETTTFHSLCYRLQAKDAKIIFSHLFQKLDVEEEIEKFRWFYDLGTTKSKP